MRRTLAERVRHRDRSAAHFHLTRCRAFCGAEDDNARVERDPNPGHPIVSAESELAKLECRPAGKSGVIFERLGGAEGGGQPILGSIEDSPSIRAPLIAVASSRPSERGVTRSPLACITRVGACSRSSVGEMLTSAEA